MLVFFFIICPGVYTLLGISINAKNSANVYDTSVYYPTYPTPNTKGKGAEQIKMINRGAYLVKVGDCIACHTNTDKKGIAFAGGLAMATPFGTIYTPNITPDKETGIGNWTDEQFIKAMHEGISPSGEYYFPAFPYLYFNQITVPDLRAIKVYLESIPAVHQENHENNMVWPFNWRFIQLGWRILFFYPSAGPYKNNPAKTVQWNRGAYLIEGLGHCAMCHTPSYYIVSEQLSLGAPIKKYNLTGAVVEGYLAPNITKTNLGAIPDEQLIQTFSMSRMIGGAQLQGPMLEAVHDSLSHLTHEDMIALAVYLKSVQSEMPPAPKVGKSAEGAYIYNSYCSGCHASGVGGAPKFGDKANWSLLAGSGINKLYAVAIGGGGNMPAKGTCLSCSDSDIKSAVDYMVAATMQGVDPVSQVPLSAGANVQKFYQANCSGCHSSGSKAIPQLGDKKAWKPILGEGFLKAYKNIMAGRNGHPLHAGCQQCTDQEILDAVKYMLQKGSANKNYILW
ncbi:MAG: hypothetical protein A3E84_00985 [Gammaproteobacteria bacterium RIFCSPHIGHO2_12_FULL_42_13]|nr:MAG: hypothetical protein A3E84_00985 [Gammaproteobacteria bacterium RIFCSPHIGHO2_12_FULL_42_13]